MANPQRGAPSYGPIPVVAFGQPSYIGLWIAIGKNGSTFCKLALFNAGANGKAIMTTLHGIYGGPSHLGHRLVKRITQAALMKSDAVIIARITLVFANVSP